MEIKKLIESTIPPLVIQEASYKGNMGFEEMMKFYQKASQDQITRLEVLMKRDRIKQAWGLVQKVTGINLQGIGT